MKLCMPVIEDKGMDSQLSAHFGSAPIFLIVDTDTLSCKCVENANQHHEHGMCQPLNAVAGEHCDAIVVGGIGAGALQKLQSANIKVYKSLFKTVKEAIDAYRSDKLQQANLDSACNHHGCGH